MWPGSVVDVGHCVQQGLPAGPGPVGLFGEVAPPGPCAGDALEQPQHMTGDVMQAASPRQFLLDILLHLQHDSPGGGRPGAVAEDPPVGGSEQPGVVVGRPPDHRPVDLFEVPDHLVQAQDSTVDDDL